MTVIKLKEKSMTAPMRARLSHTQFLKLADKVRVDYKTCGLDNDAYALKATADLGFQVGVSSVQDVLRVLEIAPNNPPIRKGTAINLSAEARLKIELMWETLGNMNPDMLRKFNEQDL